MKKHYHNSPPHQKISQYCLFALSLLLLFTVSCKKEIVTAPQQTFNVSAGELTSVKQWFNTGNNLDLLAKPASWLNSTSAKWDKAYSQTFNKQNVYELAISNPDRIFAATGTVDTKQIERYENRSLIVYWFSKT